ncbi:hypothetical protein CIW49_11450 [Mycolicibacterium sp. P1-18]|uniref:hypothetical protein n=1 Tax=Mycolicibacterium sp. P1-18 TaxID=2024615 RepID=UPI0011F1D846|nr:hypothetical protein [Mycolicibacterium sp. P1-18]KAA0098550.1 hypothetical protein CIW49_11450 [Mycolicibacterium sp. P1-18]
MTTIFRTVAAATMIGAAALGLAGAANAATFSSPQGPGNVYSPGTYATPAPTVGPGWYGNHGPAYIAHLNGK